MDADFSSYPSNPRKSASKNFFFPLKSEEPKGESMATTTGLVDINAGKLYYEVAGEGQPLVLIHGGLVNSGLWDDQFEVFAQHQRVVRYDVRGFGKSAAPTHPYSNHADLKALLDFLSIDTAAVLGLSMGGAIAIDFTLTNPKRVAALIPVAAGLGGYQFDAAPALQTEMRAAYDRGDKARAAEISLQMWTDGPNRTPDQVDPLVRERIRAMTLHMFELPDTDPDYRQQLDPPAVLRLKEIHVPTLFVVGDQDVRGILDIADLIVKDVPGARMAIIPGTAHHLNMEKPAEFNQIVLDFLNSLGSS